MVQVSKLTSFGVANLSLQVIVVLALKVLDTLPIAPLCVGIDVHLDDAIIQGLANIRDIGTGTAMEHKGNGLLVRWGIAAELLADVLLRPTQDLGLELNITGTVNAVNIAEGSCDSEHVRDGTELLVHLVNLLGLGVQVLQGNVGVVNAILLAASDAELHFQQDANLRHAGEIVLANVNVLLDGLLGKVDHVRREEGLAVLLVVTLRGGEETINPGKELLGAVIRVEDDGNAVLLGHGADVEGAGNGAGDSGLVVVVVEALASVELRSARGELDDHGSVVLASGLEAGVDARGGNAVDSGNSIPCAIEDETLCMRYQRKE